MRIALCSSIDFSQKIMEVKKELEKMGHETDIPFYTQKIMDEEVSIDEYLRIKEKSGDIEFRKKSGEDLIKRHFNNINKCDAILVLNFDKKGIKNYIGGNTFLEMGFAHVLNKKIFLYNDLPEMGYSNELKAMNSIVINGDLNKIK
jgi:hypothetical protein